MTRTFPVSLTNSYTVNSIIELCHFRDITFDSDERVGIYLEAWMCNLSLKSFAPAIIPEFDGDESEAEKMALFTAAENKSQKIGLRILGRKNNTGDWQEKAEIILVNRGRKDYFDLLQPYLAKNAVRILEKNDAIGVQLIDYGNGLLKTNDSIGIELGVTITIAKKNNMDIFSARLAALELALENRLVNVEANTLLGRDTSTGTIQTIPQSRFATPAQIDQAVANLAGGAPDALNTLMELASALNNNANFATTVLTALGEKISRTEPEIVFGAKTFNGFTSLGGDTAIKTKYLTGMTGATDGATNLIPIPYDLTASKIISVNTLIEYSPNNFISKGYTIIPGYEYDLIISSNISVRLKGGNSSNILNKPVRVFIIYSA